jgi:hypothetical protein
LIVPICALYYTRLLADRFSAAEKVSTLRGTQGCAEMRRHDNTTWQETLMKQGGNGYEAQESIIEQAIQIG